MAPSTVLVTGVSRYLGGSVAARLAADPSIDRVLGVDAVEPGGELQHRMGRVDVVRADLRDPLIAQLITTAEVDTVVHDAVAPGPGWGGGRAALAAVERGVLRLAARLR